MTHFRCYQCEMNIPIEQFYQLRDGHRLGHCKECHKANKVKYKQPISKAATHSECVKWGLEGDVYEEGQDI